MPCLQDQGEDNLPPKLLSVSEIDDQQQNDDDEDDDDEEDGENTPSKKESSTTQHPVNPERLKAFNVS